MSWCILDVWRSISAKNQSCHSTFNFIHQHLSWVHKFRHHAIKHLPLHVNNWFHTSQHCSSQMPIFNLKEPNIEYSKFLYWSHSLQVATSQFTNINLRPPTSPTLTLNSVNKEAATLELVLQRYCWYPKQTTLRVVIFKVEFRSAYQLRLKVRVSSLR